MYELDSSLNIKSFMCIYCLEIQFMLLVIICVKLIFALCRQAYILLLSILNTSEITQTYAFPQIEIRKYINKHGLIAYQPLLSLGC